MTGAIEFLKHARKCCTTNIWPNACNKCPLKDDIHICTLNAIESLNDDEIADLVREVERWWREND